MCNSKHNRPVCRHLPSLGATGQPLHNRAAKLLMQILNCFNSLCVYVCVRLWLQLWGLWGKINTHAPVPGGLDFEWWIFLLELGSRPQDAWSLFASCKCWFNWHSDFSSSYFKKQLFLAHCVKTWQRHPVYACAHRNNIASPQGPSALFSYCTCAKAPFALLLAQCMQSHYATLCIRYRATGPEWQPVTNHSPSQATSPLLLIILFSPDPLFISS